MLLAIDIGNTDTVVGIFDDNTLVSHFRVASALNLTSDEAGLFVLSLFNRHIAPESSEVSRVAVCSVVPKLTVVYEQMARKYFHVEPITISSRIKLPFAIDYPKPSEIGADRLANAAAGFALTGHKTIVVDIGTATTFDVISDTGSYLGGIICPGPQAAGASLANRAAKLFEIRLEKPDRIIGKSTNQALKTGLYHGTIGMIDHIIELIAGELGDDATVIATGGQAEIFAADSKFISEVVPTLTLEGIRIIADYNS